MEKNTLSHKTTDKRLLAALAMLLAVLVLGGCAGADGYSRVIFTTGFKEDELFRIGKSSCTLPEFMVYLTNTQNQYENVYGEQIWNVELEGVTLEDNVKDTVLAKIAQIKTMYLMAREREVELEAEALQRVEKAAETYYQSLTDQEIQIMGVDQDIIRQLYTEYAMAEKVYNQIIEGINPEISDDEARTITVEHILIRTYTTDGTGKRIEYSDSMKRECYEQIAALRQQALDGEADFAELAAKYSDDENLRYSFRKGEVDATLEEAAFRLGNGEISEVIELDSGYHLIRCVSTFDREETDANKLKIVEERRSEVFGREYDAFVDTLVRSLNEELWQEITLFHDSQVRTDNFFDVYEQYKQS
ncbi:MAG: peptidylprolyl isomerase [Acetatifactor sp.]|nr:peptidylprolyl isomerase [Acetatifactor sp.]